MVSEFECIVGAVEVSADDDGLEGQRALAQPRDHRLAAGLDALGDGDFALARQQFHRAHLAHVHADRVGGAAELGVDGRQRGLGLFLVGGSSHPGGGLPLVGMGAEITASLVGRA